MIVQNKLDVALSKKKWFIWVFIALLVVGVAVAVIAWRFAPASNPNLSVEHVLTAQKNGECEAYKNFTTENFRNTLYPDGFECNKITDGSWAGFTERGVRITWRLVETKIADDASEGQIKTEILIAEGDNGITSTETFALIKEGEIWKIDSIVK